MRHFRQRPQQQQHQHPCPRGRTAANSSLPILQQLAQLAVVGACMGTASAAQATSATASSAALPSGGSGSSSLLAFAAPLSRGPSLLTSAADVAGSSRTGAGGRARVVARAVSFSMSSAPVAHRSEDGRGCGGSDGGDRRLGVSSPLRAAAGGGGLLRPNRWGRGVRGERTVVNSAASTVERQMGRRGEGERRGERRGARFSWRRGERGDGQAVKGRWSGRWRRGGGVEAASASASGGSGAGAAAAAMVPTASGMSDSGSPGETGGDERAVPAADVEGAASFKLGGDLMADMKRRAKVYKSDWTDGVNRKSLPAIMFLYFACLLPAVAFGGIASQVTQGTLGVIEYVVSCGLGGMAYAAFGGQPMTFIGPTGLTLAFMTSLYSFTSVAGLPFLPVYAWVGLWTSAFLATLAFIGASNLIEFATQFTDDVFNALLSVNFIYEAVRSIMRNFSPAVAGFSEAGALLSLNVAVATYFGCRKTSGALSSRVFNKGFREFMADFGPLVVILVMSIFCGLPSCSGFLSFLEVPSEIMLCKGRSLLVPMFSVAPAVRFACALPALLLTSLFFLDQNISARVVNSPRHKMLKGPAYHQDMLVLGIITGLLSVVGLPWQCAATVQSLNHVRQMATFESAPAEAGGQSENIESIHETRVTGFCVHALVLGSLALLPQLGKIPMAVVSGIFLYLGRKVMSGNGFLIRCKELIVDRNLLPSESDLKKVGFGTAAKYTAVQAAMLTLLWTLKSFKRTALFFPSVIGLLIVVRLFALPKMFSSKDLSDLDAAVG